MAVEAAGRVHGLVGQPMTDVVVELLRHGHLSWWEATRYPLPVPDCEPQRRERPGPCVAEIVSVPDD